MDENTLQLAQDTIDELKAVLEPIGVTLRRLDDDESGGFPTVLLSAPGHSEEDVVCSVLPVHMAGIDVTFIQLYLTLTPPVPPKRRAELDRFVKEANERFMLGSLLVFQGGLCIRYALALDPATGMEAAHIQTTFAAFLHHAAIYARLGAAIANGSMTAQSALAYRE